MRVATLMPPAMTWRQATITWRHAKSFKARLRGLLGYPPPPPGHGLLIVPCRAIHTAGMRYAIDVVFIDRYGCVTLAIPKLPPWRLARCRRAFAVGELASGSIRQLGLTPGRQVIDALSLQALKQRHW